MSASVPCIDRFVAQCLRASADAIAAAPSAVRIVAALSMRRSLA